MPCNLIKQYTVAYFLQNGIDWIEGITELTRSMLVVHGFYICPFLRLITYEFKSIDFWFILYWGSKMTEAKLITELQ